MNKGYWAGDAIATNIGRIADNERSARVLREQQSYHCGDLAVQAAALAELRRLDPDNVLFKPEVHLRIWTLGESEFNRKGWARAVELTVDPREVYSQLVAEFEEARKKAIQTVDAEPIKHQRKGWPWARRDEYVFRKQKATSHAEALRLQAAERERLARARLGDKL